MAISSANPSPPAAPSAAAVTAVVTNGIRLSAVAEKLASHFHGFLSLTNTELFQLTYALARGIDYALSSNDVPRVANSIPVLVKKAFKYRSEAALNSAIMVLMISAKNACKSGWFSLDDRDEIMAMTNELCSTFCLSTDNADVGDTFVTLMKIMPQYFPQMKLCKIIVSFEAKTGYDILMSDFFIQRNMPANEKIRLFVVQKDNLENSSCIANPPLVSFLVNGKGVEKRNNVSIETGPQLPTDITKMLKYGTNIIQAVGYFNGNYIIAVAFTSKLEMANPPILEDYAELASDEPESDSEVSIGSSTVSLNCPLSFGRIKTPVKGPNCKHHQCFDYDNYMEINSRKPTWRCPSCNGTVCSLDLRLDKRMVQILKEVEANTTSVIISADGSWKINASLNNKSQQQPININMAQDSSKDKNRPEDDVIMDDVIADVAVDDVIDLTAEGNIGNEVLEREEDTKPFLDCEEFISVPHFNTPAAPPQQNLFHAAEDNAWVRSTFSPASGTLNSLVPDSILNPLTTDTNNINNMSSVSTTGPQVGTNSRNPIPRNVSRMPHVVQALPANPNPNLNPNPSSSPRNLIGFLNTLNSSSFASAQIPTGTGGSGNNVSSFMTPQNQGVPVPNRTFQHTRVPFRNSPISSSPLNPNPNSSSPLNPNPNSSGLRVHIPLSAAHRTRTVSPTAGLSASGSAQHPASETVRPDLPPEQGWRPTGRMRGSLTGDAYSSALSHYLDSPTSTPSPNPSPNTNPSSNRGGPMWSSQ